MDTVSNPKKPAKAKQDSAAVDKANAILEQDRIINLDLEAARIVFDAIANPPQPNAALTRAMERRKELLEDNSAR